MNFKKFLTVFLSGALSLQVLITGTALAANTNPCNGITVQTLRKHVPIPPATIVSKRPVDGLCEVILQIGGEYVPVYATRKFVIAGEMFQNRHQVTQETMAKLKAKKFLSLKKEADKLVAFTYTPKGKIRHTVYMFTDPVCPFCHRAETQIRQIADKYHARIKFLFFPVHIPVGREKAIQAVCEKLNAVTYLKGDWKKKNDTQKWQCEKGKEIVNKTARLARKLGIRGVPTFFIDNGQMVMGADMNLLGTLLARQK